MSMLLQQFIAAHLHGTVPLAEIPRILPGLKFPESSPSRIRNPIPHHVQTRLYKLMINRNWIFEFRLRLSGQTLRQRQGMERSSGSVSGKSSISFPSSWLNSLIDFFPISNWSGGDGVGIKPSGINSIAFRHIASFLLRSTDVINRVSIFADFTTTFLFFSFWDGGREGGRGRPNMQISKYSNEMQMARDDVCRRISTSQFSWLEMINWKWLEFIVIAHEKSQFDANQMQIRAWWRISQWVNFLG